MSYQIRNGSEEEEENNNTPFLLKFPQGIAALPRAQQAYFCDEICFNHLQDDWMKLLVLTMPWPYHQFFPTWNVRSVGNLARIARCCDDPGVRAKAHQVLDAFDTWVKMVTF